MYLPALLSLDVMERIEENALLRLHFLKLSVLFA